MRLERALRHGTGYQHMTYIERQGCTGASASAVQAREARSRDAT
jgi:hypothetical protein